MSTCCLHLLNLFSGTEFENGFAFFYLLFTLLWPWHTQTHKHICTHICVLKIFNTNILQNPHTDSHTLNLWWRQSNSCGWPHMTLKVVMAASALFPQQHHTTVPLLRNIIYLWNLHFTDSPCVWKCVCEGVFVSQHDVDIFWRTEVCVCWMCNAVHLHANAGRHLKSWNWAEIHVWWIHREVDSLEEEGGEWWMVGWSDFYLCNLCISGP